MPLLPWLSLPLVAAVYMLLWDRIPERLAVQFDTSGAVTNWMSRGQSLALNLAVLLFIIVTSTLLFLGLLKYNITGSLF